MKAFLALLLSGFPLFASADGPVTPPPLRAQLDEEAIRQAVRQVLDEHPEEWRQPARTISGNKYRQFAEEFSEARVPDCLHPDGLKRQPPAIGPVALGGLLAAPFVVLAKARGKCN